MSHVPWQCGGAKYLYVFVSDQREEVTADDERMENRRMIFRGGRTDEKSLIETTQFPRKRSTLVISDYLLFIA